MLFKWKKRPSQTYVYSIAEYHRNSVYQEIDYRYWTAFLEDAGSAIDYVDCFVRSLLDTSWLGHCIEESYKICEFPDDDDIEATIYLLRKYNSGLITENYFVIEKHSVSVSII